MPLTGARLGCGVTLSTDTANAIGCYEYLGGPQIAGCTCHSSCRACGYNDEPTEADDCITCADGSTVEAVYDDGTGRCPGVWYSLEGVRH